jgi:hypothetical protein
MVRTPTGLDVSLNQVGDITDSPASTLEVEALIENTPDDIEFMYPRSDLLQIEDFPGTEGVSNEDLVETLDEVDKVIKEDLTKIITQHPSIYTEEFGAFYSLTTDEWKQIFGEEPPGPLTTWESVWSFGKTKFVVSYQRNAQDGREHSVSLDPYEHILDDSNKTILPIRITPALALSEVGTMSLLQAQAYVLRQWGYETPAIAELLDKNVGTTSSHLNRGQKKAIQASWMTDFIDDISDVTPVDYDQIFGRVGETYKTRDGKYRRVTGVADDNNELKYELLSEHGTEYVSVDYFTRNPDAIAQCPTEEAPKPLQDATVMDLDEFRH